MLKVTLEDLLKAGVHFGHLTRRWNPKFKPLEKAYNIVKEIAATGEPVLFVGTKNQAKEIIMQEATRCEQPYIVERWLGGTLTNFATIKKSIRHLENLEKMTLDGTVEKLTKKERLHIEREIEKMKKVFSGIREMKRIPGVLYIIDIKKEEIAVREARKLGIPIVAIVDTNCDPTMVNYPIPGNDDSTKSITLITRVIADAVLEGKESLEAATQDKAEMAVKKEEIQE